ncbi:hypothetical protein C8R46DRAFT_1345147, partial [Mycena filopes]
MSSTRSPSAASGSSGSKGTTRSATPYSDDEMSVMKIEYAAWQYPIIFTAPSLHRRLIHRTGPRRSRSTRRSSMRPLRTSKKNSRRGRTPIGASWTSGFVRGLGSVILTWMPIEHRNSLNINLIIVNSFSTAPTSLDWVAHVDGEA